MKATDYLNEAAAIIKDRASVYDKHNEGTRSMVKVVGMFHALTGVRMTAEQGWKFMACLKLARSEQGKHRLDNYIDGAAYIALAAEAAEQQNKANDQAHKQA